MFFVDTNIFLRFLSGDDQEKAGRCRELLNQLSGKFQLFTSELVIAELVWVLQSPKNYGLHRQEICDILLPLVSAKNLFIPNKEIYPSVLELFAESDLDYIDAYHVILMKQKEIKAIYSYDFHFDGLQDIRRLEP